MVQTNIFQLLVTGDLDSLYTIMNDQYALILFLTFIIILVQNFVTFLPLLLILTKNIAIFGFVYGVLWSWLFSVIAAAAVFITVRYVCKDFFKKKINANLQQKIEANGFMYVFVLRVFSFIPTSLINMVCGISSLKFKDFIFATSIGNLLYFFALSLIPLGILNGNLEETILLLIAGIMIFAIFFYKKHKKKKQNNYITTP